MDGGGEETVSGNGATLSSDNEKHCQSSFLKYRSYSIFIVLIHLQSANGLTLAPAFPID